MFQHPAFLQTVNNILGWNRQFFVWKRNPQLDHNWTQLVFCKVFALGSEYTFRTYDFPMRSKKRMCSWKGHYHQVGSKQRIPSKPGLKRKSTSLYAVSAQFGSIDRNRFRWRDCQQQNAGPLWSNGDTKRSLAALVLGKIDVGRFTIISIQPMMARDKSPDNQQPPTKYCTTELKVDLATIHNSHD